MLRHTALFLHRDTISEDQKLAMLRGLAFLRMECAGVRAGDYGQDLFGGSSPLLAVPPWKRTPRWRARCEGPPCNYDVALHLDFDDEAAAAASLAGERYRAVARFNASITVPELTARVEWRYDGAPLVRRGLVRHTAMFVWAGEGRCRALACTGGGAQPCRCRGRRVSRDRRERRRDRGQLRLDGGRAAAEPGGGPGPGGGPAVR
jgi:hypothetical protein